MKTIKKKESWEERFDKMVYEGKLPFIDYSKPICPNFETHRHILKFKLKSFISTLLKAQKQEIIGIIEGMKKTTGILGILGTTHRDGVINEGFNQAISDLIEKIKGI